MNNFKRIACCLLAFVLMLTVLVSCVREGEYPPEFVPNAHTPPSKEAAGDGTSTFEAQLYFVSPDRSKLITEVHTLSRASDESYAEASIRALLNGPLSRQYFASVPEDLTFERVELSADVCNVYLNGRYPQDANDWLVARAAIAATVFDAEGIGSINLYLNGIEPGYFNDVPLGVQYPITTSLGAYLSDMRLEYSLPAYSEDSDPRNISNSATFYYTALDKNVIVAQNKEITYQLGINRWQMASLLLEELFEGSTGEYDLELVLNDPVIREMQVITTSGTVITMGEDVAVNYQEGCYINVVVSSSDDYIEENIVGAAIAMTLSGYIPNVLGVTVRYQQNGTIRMLAPGKEAVRLNYLSVVGHVIDVSYPSVDGSVLLLVPRLISSQDIYKANARLDVFFDGPASPGVMYKGLTIEDVEDVYVVGNMVVLNWKSGFADKLSAILNDGTLEVPASRREALYIYGIVNTLTELPGINSVWMCEDGKQLGQIGNIYLGNPLMRNPGLSVKTN